MDKKKWMFGILIAALLISSFAFAALAQAADPNCWGQATKVFAATGAMGEHASQQETPRDGLHNLAVALYKDGVLPDDSLAALGAFVAELEGLSIDACMD